LQNVTEWHHVDADIFHNKIVPAGKPALIRSLCQDWPAVTQCGTSAEATCSYLQRLDTGKPVYTIAAPAEADGRFFYSDDLQGLNFKRGQILLSQVLTQLLNQENQADAHAIAVQALPVRDILPDFENENPIGLIDASVAPTMWVGNQGRVAPHYDVHQNLACVMAGRRRFTLFPPEQAANLYLGPMLNAPGGVPISLVDIWNPNFEQFPRYKEALASAQQAELGPSDAIYIPSLWWHGVASLDPVNVLVNYWWGGISASGLSPNDTLLHGMMSIAALDASQRQAWKTFFDYYVFRSHEDPGAHLPQGLKDIVTSLSPEQSKAVRDFLSQRLDSDK